MKKGDWLIYYSRKISPESAQPYQRFTAIGTMTDDQIEPFTMAPNFTPHRRNVRYEDAAHAPIAPLIPALGFIKNSQRWGYPFRSGHFEITQPDFALIAHAMLGRVPT